MDLYIEPRAVPSHDGYWHPAIERYQHGIMAWYNIKKYTKEEAEEFARMAIGDAKQAAIEVITAWNIQSYTEIENAKDRA
jgi:hypothetical protein